MSNTPFGQKTSKSPGFAGAGSTLFASQSPGGAEDEPEHEADHDGPHFEPIIPLPDKIDVKTGEEDEEVMFSHRAKLYRFVAEEKQWKERGVGDIKLLRNNLTGKMRVLMRREQVLKLCANHQITTDMTLQPNAGSERSWVWSTPADFSEQECKPERLAVRFKNEDIAKQFKEKFEQCQEILKDQASLKLPIQEESAHEEEVVKEDLRAKFKAEEGSWECDICMVRNSGDKLACAACANPKPGVEPSQVANVGRPLFLFESGASSGAGFSFGSAGTCDGGGNPFAPSPSGVFSFGTGAPSSGAGFSFGSAGANEGRGKPVFSFGSSSGSTQGENTAGAQSEEGTTDVPRSGEEPPSDEVDDVPQTVEEGGVNDVQDSNKERTPVKPIQGKDKEGLEEGSGKDLFEKWKPAKGSWECDICMVRNSSDKLACAACASPKPGAVISQDQKIDEKPLFGFGSTGSSTGTGFTFGLGTGSADTGFTFGSGVASTGAGFSFGSTTPSDGGENPFSSFGSQKQTSNSNSGPANFTFGSLNQTTSSPNTETRETNQGESNTDSVATSSPITETREMAQGESDTDSVVKEEKPLSAPQHAESEPQNLQRGVSEKIADAAIKQEAEEGDDTSDQFLSEERVSLSSENQPVQENDSQVKEELKHDAASQPEGGIDSPTDEPQDGVSGNTDTSTEESSQPKEEA